MRSEAVAGAHQRTSGHNTSKWTAAAQVANWERVDRGRHNKRGTYCLASTLTLTPTHQHARRHTRRHARAQREREKQREGGEAGTLRGAVRHHISTHWPPFYLLWSLSVLSFYQLGADGRTAALILKRPESAAVVIWTEHRCVTLSSYPPPLPQTTCATASSTSTCRTCTPPWWSGTWT